MAYPTFGEIVYESSRAFADDEEEEQEFESQVGLSFELEYTPVGKSLIVDRKDPSTPSWSVFSAFVGKVAVGFGDSLVNNDNLLAEVFIVGQGENVVDIYLNRPKRKSVVRVYGDVNNQTDVLVALFHNHRGVVPRYLANELVEAVGPLIDACRQIVIFHSDTMASYQSSDESPTQQQQRVFYVKSSKYVEENELPTKSSSATPLPPPNVIGGVSAALLQRGEMLDKASLLLAVYGENEMVDSISTRPFVNVIQSNRTTNLFKSLSSMLVGGGGVSRNKEFKLKSNVMNSMDTSNLYV